MSKDRLDIAYLRSRIGRYDAEEWGAETAHAILNELDRLQGELDASHRFLNDIGPPPDLPLPDRLRHWQNYCRVMREDMREKDATIASLQRPTKVYRESQDCQNCVVGAFCGRHDDLFWGAMREALASPAQEQ